jgi:hypothetical protein
LRAERVAPERVIFGPGALQVAAPEGDFVHRRGAAVGVGEAQAGEGCGRVLDAREGDVAVKRALFPRDSQVEEQVVDGPRESSEGFVARMNEKARELGLTQTHFDDPSGLLSGNVSSAFDIARLISYAAADERIGSIMRKSEFNFVPGRRNVHVNSTNRLVRQGELDVLGGKTGFISSSGYCLATLVRLPQSGRQVAMVVLGARSNAARFAETRHLFNWLNASSTATAAGEALQQQQQ